MSNPQPIPAKSAEMPAFLVAKKGEPRPMPDPHRLAVLQLTTEEAHRVWTRCAAKDKNFPPLDHKIAQADGEHVAAKALLLAAVKHGNGQAELVLAVMRDRDQMTDTIAEKLTGKPITKLPEQGAHAPRKARVTKERPQAKQAGDDYIVRLVTPCPHPRKAGTGAAIRFALYKDGMTVAEYVAKGGQRSNTQTDVARGNITLERPAKGGAT